MATFFSCMAFMDISPFKPVCRLFWQKPEKDTMKVFLECDRYRKSCYSFIS